MAGLSIHPARTPDPATESELLRLGDRAVPLTFRQSQRARRIIIRLDRDRPGVVVVLPRRATREQGRRFALANEAWIRDRLAQLPRPVRVGPNVRVPLRGTPHMIRHLPDARGTVWRDGQEIVVAGRRE